VFANFSSKAVTKLDDTNADLTKF